MVYKREGILKNIDGFRGTESLGHDYLQIIMPLTRANEKDVDDRIEEEQ